MVFTVPLAADPKEFSRRGQIPQVQMDLHQIFLERRILSRLNIGDLMAFKESAEILTIEVPKTMYAWRKHQGNKCLIWEEVPVPEAPLTGVLCKMLASGVCRSDQSFLALEDTRPWFQEKYTLGHEGCGQIVRLGSKLTSECKFKVGDKVALHAVPGCGHADCPECSRGLAQLCELGHHSGIGQDGFYAPYAAIDVRGLVLVPDAISPAEAAVATDAVATAWHAITRRGEAKQNETVFLFGLGGLGFSALQILLSIIGCRVFVSDIREDLLREAQELGVPASDIVPHGQSVQEFAARNGMMGEIDTVFDFVGAHQTFEDSQQIVRRGGKIVNVGTLNTENTVHMKIGIRKRLSFMFSYGAQVEDLQEVLGHIAKGNIRPQVEHAALEDLPTLIEDLVAGKIRSRVAIIHA